MLNRILDKYFLNKIADYFLEIGKNYYCLDFKIRIEKDTLYIDVNYKDEERRLEKYRKVASISKEDMIHIVSNLQESSREFRNRVDEVLQRR